LPEWSTERVFKVVSIDVKGVVVSADTPIWRGPFTVKRDGRSKFKIVNRHGDTERLGFVFLGAAEEVAQLMNLAHQFCDRSGGF
jgi:hypothetical protein